MTINIKKEKRKKNAALALKKNLLRRKLNIKKEESPKD
jgi:hypothetical protein